MSPHFFNNSMFVLFIPSKCFKLDNFPQQHNNKTNKNQRSRKLRNHKSNECRAWDEAAKSRRRRRCWWQREIHRQVNVGSALDVCHKFISFAWYLFNKSMTWSAEIKQKYIAQITPYLGWWSVRFTIHPTVLASLHRSEKTYEQWFFNGVAQKTYTGFWTPVQF